MLQADKNSIRFNGEDVSMQKLRDIIAGIFDPAILIEKSGFILRFGIEEEKDRCIVHLGLLPAIINGVRIYHYAITISERCLCTLTGFFSATGELSVFPDFFSGRRNASKSLSESEKKVIIGLYRLIGELFIYCGLDQSAELSSPTTQTIGELALSSTVPVTAGELLSLPKTVNFF